MGIVVEKIVYGDDVVTDKPKFCLPAFGGRSKICPGQSAPRNREYDFRDLVLLNSMEFCRERLPRTSPDEILRISQGPLGPLTLTPSGS